MSVLFMGFAFKENCSDIRNSKIYNLYINLINKVNNIDIYDPYVNKSEVKKIYNINLTQNLKKNKYDAIYILLSHKKFIKLGHKYIKSLGKKKCIIYDLKNIFLKGDFSY